jgi:DNA-binding XRE family transcriptional regulator
MLGSPSVAAYELEFYEDENGDVPVLRWLREELTPTKRRALGHAMNEVLQLHGVGVCATKFGKQLGEGLFEFRLGRDLREIAPDGETDSGKILLRVFCHAHGNRLILLVGGYDKGSTVLLGGRTPRSRLLAHDCETGGGFRHHVGLTHDVARHILSSGGWSNGSIDMSLKFSDFMEDLEAEARREGPKAVAEMRAFEAHFRLASELILLRKRRKLTQRQLSTKSGVQQAEISRIEGGRANPTVSTLSALASALGGELGIRISAGSRRPRSVHAGRGRHAARPRPVATGGR